MTDENSLQPIGDPQPVEASKELRVWPVVNAIAVATIGVVAFTVLVRPTRVSGASRSARLQWQQRQQEVQQTTEPASSMDQKVGVEPTKVEKPASANP